MKQHHYHWTGIDLNGNLQSGTFKISNKTALKNNLKDQQITPIKIRRHWKNVFSFTQRISMKSKLIFLQQIAQLLAADINMHQALQLITKQQKKKPLKKSLIQLTDSIAKGKSLAQSLKAQSHLFDTEHCALIQAGEVSNTLPDLLNNLHQHLSLQYQFKSKIGRSLLYPACVFFITLLITAGLLTFAMPQIEALYQNFNATLPIYTKTLLSLAKIISSQKVMILISFILTSVFIAHCKKFAILKKQIDRLLLKLNIYRNLQAQRWLSCMHLLLQAKISLFDSIQMTQAILSNTILKTRLRNAILQLQKGGAFSEVLPHLTFLNPQAIQLLQISEHSHQLIHTFQQVAQLNEQQLSNQLDLFSKLIEPAMMLFLAVFVGSIVLAIYLPIFQLGNIF